ncbi:hypothetical protein [Brevundimonas sp.]|jgi:hypothetical protein|uniref:hypothetical protein n=1 Tax=Brevundimonas sp. TaxID=1871086 RepID=UPI003D1360FD
MTLEDWKAMSTASCFWFVAVMLLAVSVVAFAFFTVAAPTLDPGKFSYEAFTLEGRVSISSYKGQPVLVITDGEGRNHASRCNPYDRDQACVDLALVRGLRQDQQVKVGFIRAKFWPLADDTIIRLASNDHVFLDCADRLGALGVDRSRISGVERIAGC